MKVGKLGLRLVELSLQQRLCRIALRFDLGLKVGKRNLSLVELGLQQRLCRIALRFDLGAEVGNRRLGLVELGLQQRLRFVRLVLDELPEINAIVVKNRKRVGITVRLAIFVLGENNDRVAAGDRDLGRRLVFKVVINKPDRRIDDQRQPLLGDLNTRQRNRAGG